MKIRSGKAALVFSAVALALLFFVLQSTEAFDRELILADYARLKQHLSEAYANLEWVTDHRELDLKALDTKTAQAISEASSPGEARDALHSGRCTRPGSRSFARMVGAADST